MQAAPEAHSPREVTLSPTPAKSLHKTRRKPAFHCPRIISGDEPVSNQPVLLRSAHTDHRTEKAVFSMYTPKFSGKKIHADVLNSCENSGLVTALKESNSVLLPSLNQTVPSLPEEVVWSCLLKDVYNQLSGACSSRALQDLPESSRNLQVVCIAPAPT